MLPPQVTITGPARRTTICRSSRFGTTARGSPSLPPKVTIAGPPHHNLPEQSVRTTAGGSSLLPSQATIAGPPTHRLCRKPFLLRRAGSSSLLSQAAVAGLSTTICLGGRFGPRRAGLRCCVPGADRARSGNCAMTCPDVLRAGKLFRGVVGGSLSLSVHGPTAGVARLPGRSVWGVVGGFSRFCSTCWLSGWANASQPVLRFRGTGGFFRGVAGRYCFRSGACRRVVRCTTTCSSRGVVASPRVSGLLTGCVGRGVSEGGGGVGGSVGFQGWGSARVGGCRCFGGCC